MSYLGAADLPIPVSVEQLEAKIQARVAQFLGLKDKLINIRNRTKDPNVSGQADVLYQAQLQAEAGLKDALAALEEIKVNGLSFDRITRVSSGAALMEYQVKKVKALEAQFLREKGVSTPVDWYFWGRVGLLIGGAYMLWARR